MCTSSGSQFTISLIPKGDGTQSCQMSRHEAKLLFTKWNGGVSDNLCPAKVVESAPKLDLSKHTLDL
eukprot:6746841-Ditylum_brightwellii.AAC.1